MNPRKSYRTYSATTKLTSEQLVAVKAQAEAQGIDLSEYIRRALLGTPAHDQTPNPIKALLQAQLEETLVLRSIILNLAGDQAGGIPLTPERLRDVRARADAEKVDRARSLLAETTNNQPEVAIANKETA